MPAIDKKPSLVMTIVTILFLYITHKKHNKEISKIKLEKSLEMLAMKDIPILVLGESFHIFHVFLVPAL